MSAVSVTGRPAPPRGRRPFGAWRLSGNRLHLQQGPIDLIVRAEGAPAAVEQAYRRACGAFDGLLEALAAQLDALRRPLDTDRAAVPERLGDGSTPASPAARRMLAATAPLAGYWLTPMAAVAGAVADTVAAAMLDTTAGARNRGLRRLFVNNGGDIALWLASGEAFDLGVIGEPVPVAGLRPDANAAFRLRAGGRPRYAGVATSGWQGRSHSLGIADAVTVLAASAAGADAAATLVANAVDSDHPAVRRRPARELDPDSDLGARPVTVAVPPLPPACIDRALDAGLQRAVALRAAGALDASLLTLQRRWRRVDPLGVLE